MTPDPVDEAIVQLTAAGWVSPDLLRGCTEAEIGEIQVKYGIRLPVVYRRFLEKMGKCAGKLLVGTDYSFPNVLTLREQAEHLLRECKAQVSLDKTDFVFAVHQGYQFLFFRSGMSEDPEVFLYEESQEFKKVAEAFSEWLIGCVADEIAAAKAQLAHETIPSMKR